MITRSELYIYSVGDLESKELRSALCTALKEYGSTRAMAKAIGWHLATVSRLLHLKVVPDLPGQEIFSLRLADVKGRSLPAVKKDVRRAVVRAVAHLGSMRAIGRAWSLPDRDIRRLLRNTRSI